MVETSSTRRALLTLSLIALLAACGDATATPRASVSSAPASAGPASSVAATAQPTLAPVPSYAAATPVAEQGGSDTSELIPPTFETGDVPAYEAPAPAVTSNAKTGAAAQLATGSAGPDGGTITVSKPGDPLDGLTITVPAGTYATTVSFTISEKSLDTTTIASGYTAASAVVTIDNGGAVATGDPVLVTIPASVPDGADVAGLYLHPDASLDLLPVVAKDAKGATVAASHFSDIVLAVVDWTKIPATVDSGFRPGADDWEFPNYGSFIAPGGHCLGQSLTAIWYYDTKRLSGASPLNGLYDNNGAGLKTPALWQDDSDGYRLASTIQRESPAIPTAATWFRSFKASPNVYAYAMLRAAIGLTGHPQLVSIADAQGGSKHAIIAYRVTPQRIYVADPNYPGKLRSIKWDETTGALGPYYSGDSAGSIAAGGGVAYTQFAFLPYTAAVSDATVGARWAEFETGKIGDDVFPSLPLEYFTGAKDATGQEIWAPLDPTVTTSEQMLRVRVTGSPAGTLLRAYLGARQVDKQLLELKIKLQSGANDVGVSEFGGVGGSYKYVDFLRSTVTYEPIDINGTWKGTLTFDKISVDEAARKKAKEQGCDFAILEALKDKPLPATLEFDVDRTTGKGTGTLTIDASAAMPESSDASQPQPVPLKVTYQDGKIAFDLSEACGGSGSACSMTGTVSGGPTTDPADDTIDGTVTVTGEGYSAGATFTVTREP